MSDSQPISPLEIPEIVAAIFSQFFAPPAKNNKNYFYLYFARQVCRMWRDEATLWLRKVPDLYSDMPELLMRDGRFDMLLPMIGPVFNIRPEMLSCAVRHGRLEAAKWLWEKIVQLPRDLIADTVEGGDLPCIKWAYNIGLRSGLDGYDQDKILRAAGANKAPSDEKIREVIDYVIEQERAQLF
jgi:hypothetical protein